jgi:cephalosporin hydroxylase
MNFPLTLKTGLRRVLPASAYEAIREMNRRRRIRPVRSFFDLGTVYAGHYQVTYRGVKAVRCPFDYVLYQMVINEVKPDLIIEIGTHMGGGSLYLADLLATFGNGVVHTIDILELVESPLVLDHPRIRRFTGGWEGYDLELAKPYSRVLVIEDGAHTYEHSLGAIRKFHPLVSAGSYLIVEDGIVDDLGMKEQFHGGPVRAIEEFLDTNQDFLVDRKWCDFFGRNATFNVDGYLKRKDA